MTPQQPYEYEIALSFCDAQREEARAVAAILNRTGVRTFFDEDEHIRNWGRDLTEETANVYYLLSRYCLMFISQSYVEKMWTRHERRHAIARAIERDETYILPVRFDDAPVPGLSPSMAYIRWKGAEETARMVLQKLGVRADVIDLKAEGNPIAPRGAYSIFVLGKTGVGKSALIRYLASTSLRPVAMGPASPPVQQIIIRGVPVTVLEAAGNNDANYRDLEKVIATEIDANNSMAPPESWFHTLLYCIDAECEDLGAEEIAFLNELASMDHQLIVVFTKADRSASPEHARRRQKLLSQLSTRAAFVDVCSETGTLPGGRYVEQFGISALHQAIVTGFWRTLTTMLPHHCVAPAYAAVDAWQRGTRVAAQEGDANPEKSEVDAISAQAEKLRDELIKDIIPKRIAAECPRVLQLYTAISGIPQVNITIEEVDAQRILVNKYLDKVVQMSIESTPAMPDLPTPLKWGFNQLMRRVVWAKLERPLFVREVCAAFREGIADIERQIAIHLERAGGSRFEGTLSEGSR